METLSRREFVGGVAAAFGGAAFGQPPKSASGTWT
jgi:hypothetical protein